MKKFTLLLLMVFPLWSNPNYPEKLNTFLTADTEKAKELLHQMSSEELLEFYNLYLQNKSLKERRYLWLIEEYHQRQADETAKERLIYLSLAITLLLFLIWLFTYLTYRRIKNIDYDRTSSP